jgi:hypothetical protein
MSLDRQSGRPMSRRERQQRAYQVSVVGAGAGVATVVAGILAVIGVIGFTLPVLALLLTIACFVAFRRTVGGG